MSFTTQLLRQDLTNREKASKIDRRSPHRLAFIAEWDGTQWVATAPTFPHLYTEAPSLEEALSTIAEDAEDILSCFIDEDVE